MVKKMNASAEVCVEIDFTGTFLKQFSGLGSLLSIFSCT